MDPSDVERHLRDYIVNVRLGGDGSSLEPTSPLLAWGVLDSLSVVDLVTFIEEQFHVTVPADEVTAQNLENLEAIRALVLRRIDARA